MSISIGIADRTSTPEVATAAPAVRPVTTSIAMPVTPAIAPGPWPNRLASAAGVLLMLAALYGFLRFCDSIWIP
jgi:hypothetical protein